MCPILQNIVKTASILILVIVQVLAGNAAAGIGTAGSGSGSVLQASYDFVIVGGGTSGCVLANRLSEKFAVLVLEEGGIPPEAFDVPALVVGSLNATSPAIKHYFTVPQKNAGLDSNNGRMAYMIGKTLGGGSQVNGMAFNRGSPHDYDNWANLTGDPSWKYEKLLKYFKLIEDYHGNFSENSDQHGKGGPIPISDPKYMPGFEALMKAGEYFGYPSRRDPNGPEIPSFAPFEWSQRAGRRVSSYRGYIVPIIQSRPRLNIITEAKVLRIIFDSSNTRAIGVSFMHSPQQKSGIHPDDSMETRYVGASKEVIISAGVIDSPTILMRSGIGPLDVLESSNIPAVKILPVGHNLHDHLLFQVDFLINRNTSAGLFIPTIDLNPETWKEYLETGDGPYSCLAGENNQIFWVSDVRSREDWPNPEWADVHFVHSQMAVNFQSEDKLVTISTRPYLSRPKSRGRVTLNSSDVDAMPLIDLQFLSDPDDIQILLDAVKTIVKLYENAPSFKEQGCRLKDTQAVNCDGGNFEFGSDEYWKCVIRHRSACGLHGGGSCRMGRGNGDDPEAVVDTRLRVIGMERLRVVDLSVAPQVTNTNTQPVAYVVAEKAADMIKEDWYSVCKSGGVGSGGDMSYCF